MTPAKAMHARFLHVQRQAEEARHLVPMWLVTSRDGTVTPLVASFGSPEAKATSLTAARMLAIAEDASMVAHVAEAWVVVGTSPEGVAPSQSERRVECVVVLLSACVGVGIRRLSSVRVIQRGENGEPVGLAPIAGLPKGKLDMGGPMSDVPPNRPTAEHRLVARVALERMGVRRAVGWPSGTWRSPARRGLLADCTRVEALGLAHELRRDGTELPALGCRNQLE